MKILFKIIPLIFLGLIAFIFFKGLRTEPQALPSAILNKPFPAFDKNHLENPKKSIDEKILLGHMSLVNVFASWCVSCAIEHPMLMKLSQDGIVIYGLDYKDDRASGVAYLKRYGDPYKKVIVDDSGSLAIDLGVYGTPETFVVNEKGVIVYKYVGIITPSVWDKELAQFFRARNTLSK